MDGRRLKKKQPEYITHRLYTIGVHGSIGRQPIRHPHRWPPRTYGWCVRGERQTSTQNHLQHGRRRRVDGSSSSSFFFFFFCCWEGLQKKPSTTAGYRRRPMWEVTSSTSLGSTPRTLIVRSCGRGGITFRHTNKRLSSMQCNNTHTHTRKTTVQTVFLDPCIWPSSDARVSTSTWERRIPTRTVDSRHLRVVRMHETKNSRMFACPPPPFLYTPRKKEPAMTIGGVPTRDGRRHRWTLLLAVGCCVVFFFCTDKGHRSRRATWL